MKKLLSAFTMLMISSTTLFGGMITTQDALVEATKALKSTTRFEEARTRGPKKRRKYVAEGLSRKSPITSIKLVFRKEGKLHKISITWEGMQKFVIYRKGIAKGSSYAPYAKRLIAKMSELEIWPGGDIYLIGDSIPFLYK